MDLRGARPNVRSASNLALRVESPAMPTESGAPVEREEARGTSAIEFSVVIPAYNEAERLRPSLESALAYFERTGRRPGSWEIVVVDDGSLDGTAAIAQEFAARGVRVERYTPNRGKGAAVKAGLLASRGRTVLISDADFSTPIDEVEKLSARLVDAEVVIGSRAVSGSDVRERQPFYREWMGKIFNRVIRLAGLRGFRDTQCGFKLFDGEAARRLAAEMTIDGFAFDVELLWLALARGYAVAEVGVVWINSAASKVHPIRSSLSMLRDLARIRWRHRG